MPFIGHFLLDWLIYFYLYKNECYHFQRLYSYAVEDDTPWRIGGLMEDLGSERLIKQCTVCQTEHNVFKASQLCTRSVRAPFVWTNSQQSITTRETWTGGKVVCFVPLVNRWSALQSKHAFVSGTADLFKTQSTRWQFPSMKPN